MQPQPPSGKRASSFPGSEAPLVSEEYAQAHVGEINRLRDALLAGIAIENGLWSRRMTDWVVSLQIADIDGDGNPEILIGSRSGDIRAYTPLGERRWKRVLAGEQPYLSALTVLPLQEEHPNEETRIIAGLRNGEILALDKHGKVVPGWHYQTDRIIRQLFVSNHNPQLVAAVSEDRRLHVLDRADGHQIWQFAMRGWARCVLIEDIDGDGQEEIVVGSGDKNLYILTIQGELLHRFSPGYQIYALYAGPLQGQRSLQIVMSSNRKDLEAWQFTRVNQQQWREHRLWGYASNAPSSLFKNRIHSICLRDMNDDGDMETLVGTEDGYLMVLDRNGYLLWKKNFHSCIYRITAADIDYDGNIELVVGTEDHTAYVERLELARDTNPSAFIQESYTQAAKHYGLKHITKRLTERERTLLNDFIDEPFSRPARMEVDQAKTLVQQRHYRQALSILLRLYEQKAQYRWDTPFITKGYIWGSFFSNLTGEPGKELVIGTDQGQIYGIDLTRATGKTIWNTEIEKSNPSNRVRKLCPGAIFPDWGATTIAVLANYHVILLDQQGHIVQEQQLEEQRDWARYPYFHPGEPGEPGEIVLGMESGIVSFWDSRLSIEKARIQMPQGIGALAITRLEPHGPFRVISGGLQNRVYAATKEGRILWEFKTQDRVQSLRVADIDKDGYTEVIVGSEDRNIYVLDHLGHLKWNYRTRRGVMDIDVEEVKMRNDPDDPTERDLKILISSADGYLYMFNSAGDLIWKYRSTNRMRGARIEDIDQDGRYEIAVAMDDQLELLQILDIPEVSSLIIQCMASMTNGYENHAALRELTDDNDPYIRGEALGALGGLDQHEEQDKEYLLKAFRQDEAIQAKRGLIRAIVNLCHSPEKRGDGQISPAQYQENLRMARKLLDLLYHDPDEEIRLEIIQILPLLDAELFFRYLERSSNHPDIWVRRSVVRQLDRLVEIPLQPTIENWHPNSDQPTAPRAEQIFGLLVKTVQDEDSWIRLESGRVLAHYFDTHLASFVADLMTLLFRRIELAVLLHITHCVQHPLLQPLFRNLLRQVTELTPENLSEILDEAICCIKAINEQGPIYGEEWLQIYEEFHELARVKIINNLAGYQRITRSEIEGGQEIALLSTLMPTFDAISKAAHTVALYERRQAFGERVSTLIDARQILENARRDLRQPPALETESLELIKLPGQHILNLLLAQWLKIVDTELRRVRGSARLEARLGNTSLPHAEQVTITLQIENKGQCAADNVRVTLEENPQFTILSEPQKTFQEISTQSSELANFTLHLQQDRALVSFLITYTDTEESDKIYPYADQIVVRNTNRPYVQFKSPYSPGPPIRDKEKFVGRTKDLAELSKNLSSNTTTRVILLRGQRRMGKTSLIYRLTNELATNPCTPVLIDMQSFALLTSPDQLLEGFARTMREQIRLYKGTDIEEPAHEDFATSASEAFRGYLAAIKQRLPDQRLILLIDEFDEIQRLVKQNGDGILRYLRGLMQHNPDLSFLLASVPHMPYTEGYHAIFFNLVQEHNLGGLSPDEARDLIIEPVRDNLEYDNLALEKMLALTDGWPYFIHVMGDRLVEHCNQLERPYVSVNEVNAVLDIVLNEQASSIRWIWENLSRTERLVLALLAQDAGQTGQIYSLNDIQKSFDTYSVPFVLKDVVKALENLSRGDIVREAQYGVQYNIPLGLLRAWLRKEKPPERVVREEKFFEDEMEESL